MECSSGELRAVGRDMSRHGSGYFLLHQGFLVEGHPPGTTNQFGASLPVDLLGGAYWSLLLVSPQSEAMGTMATFRKQLLIVTCVTRLLVGVMSIVLSWIVITRQQEKRSDLLTSEDFVRTPVCKPDAGWFLGKSSL